MVLLIHVVLVLLVILIVLVVLAATIVSVFSEAKFIANGKVGNRDNRAIRDIISRLMSYLLGISTRCACAYACLNADNEEKIGFFFFKHASKCSPGKGRRLAAY